MRQINSFLAALRTAYLQQGKWGRILLLASFLLLFCCLCSILIPLLRSRPASNPVPSPVLFPSEGTQPTPTALFDFDFPTFTPFPTSTVFVPSPFPTLTPSPTGTETPTPTIPPDTATPLPTDTATATPTSTSSVMIINVDKVAEYVEIQNLTQATVALGGWRLVSENGNESCALRGTLDPNEVRRIWARNGNPGFDCRLGRAIWSDDEPDPAVLYNRQGEEVSRYP